MLGVVRFARGVNDASARCGSDAFVMKRQAPETAESLPPVLFYSGETRHRVRWNDGKNCPKLKRCKRCAHRPCTITGCVEHAVSCFSNFESAAVEIDGSIYTTSEHAYQALRYMQPRFGESHEAAKHRVEYASLIRKAKTPAASFLLAQMAVRIKEDGSVALPPGMPAHLPHQQAALRYYNVGVRPPPPSTEQEQGQHDIKLMERVVLAKFEQNPRLWEVLDATGEAQIVEHSVRDSFFADGSDGSGENHLGKVLMRVRALLRQKRRRRSLSSCDP